MSRVMVVTGGSRGIGAATTRLAAAHGYAICFNYLKDEEAAARVSAEVEELGGTAIPIKADVSDEHEIVRLFAEVDERLGPVQVLVNNAGALGPKARLDEMSAARISRSLTVNVLGQLLCAREAVKRMSTTHGGAGGAIINLSSAVAYLGGAGEWIDYAASKGAIDSFTVGLAREVAGEGVRVNAVRPGIIETDIHASGGDPDRPQRVGPLTPLKRAGTPEEVAEVIIWLASDAASYVVGTIINVTGGR